jgi:glycosyltransferase involved in cell wall biosynthesis
MIAPQNSRSNAEFPEKPVRVLLVAPSLRILGGQAVQANYLLEKLSREPMFEVSFVPHNPRFPGPLRLLQRIKYVRTLATSLVYCISLLLKIPRHDVIHVFSASYLSFLLAPTPAIFIGRLFGKKVILNYHSGEAEDHLRCWPRTFGLQAHAISNVVDQEQFKFRERKPLRPIFLSNRNLYLLYNVACTLRAFARIQQRFPEARLIVAGGGRQRPYLESLASELKLQNVEFRGLVSPDKMNELYDEADIYLNSSNIDNMPGSIIESFACGLPVVSTNAGGIRYIVTHGRTGLLVPKNDFEAMASWAIRLLETPELAESIARNAYEECPAYTWPAVRETWVAAYLRLVGVRQRSTQIYADQIS